MGLAGHEIKSLQSTSWPKTPYAQEMNVTVLCHEMTPIEGISRINEQQELVVSNITQLKKAVRHDEMQTCWEAFRKLQEVSYPAS